jgi:hypothetical protein
MQICQKGNSIEMLLRRLFSEPNSIIKSLPNDTLKPPFSEDTKPFCLSCLLSSKVDQRPFGEQDGAVGEEQMQSQQERSQTMLPLPASQHQGTGFLPGPFYHLRRAALPVEKLSDPKHLRR